MNEEFEPIKLKILAYDDTNDYVTFENIKDKYLKQFKNIKKNYIEVVAIYPIPEQAKYLNHNDFIWSFNPLNWMIMPDDMLRRNLSATIDLNNDGYPDILIFHYCCGYPWMDYGQCKGNCSKIYIKDTKGDKWKLLYYNMAC
jgi:hypothetical protein